MLSKKIVGIVSGTLFFCGNAIADTNTNGVITLSGGEHADAIALGVQMPVELPFEFLRSPKIATALEFSIGYWKGRDGNQNYHLFDAAVLPILRYFPQGTVSGQFFLEGGIGAHLLSDVRIREDRNLSTAFQFGDFLGAGWRFGETAKKYEFGLRIHHVSNGGIKQPNPGVNFIQARFVFPF